MLVLIFCFFLASGTSWHEPLLRGVKISRADADTISKQTDVNARLDFSKTRSALVPIAMSGCVECEYKDYSAPCPVNWKLTGDGMCDPPCGYSGVCKKTQLFALSNAVEKAEQEILCSVCWPCKGTGAKTSCKPEWAHPCPYGYSPKPISWDSYGEADGKLCVADIEYDGPCETEVAFKEFVEKKQFAERCDVSWPCASVCEEGFDQCPEGWSYIGESTCVAPSNFKAVGCKLVHQFRGWTNKMKQQFADSCHVTWPCAPSNQPLPPTDGALTSGPHSDDSCPLDVSGCPRSWVKMASGDCQPIAESPGACGSSPVRLLDLSYEQKVSWASDCFVNWPCEGESVEKSASQARGVFHLDTDSEGPVDVDGGISHA